MTIKYRDPDALDVDLQSVVDDGEHVGVRAPHASNEQVLTNVSGAADFTSAWLDCRRFTLLSITVKWTADAGTSFDLTLEGTDDPAQGAGGLVPLPDISVPVDATAGAAIMQVKNPPGFVRLIGTGSGGAANQFNGWATRRSA